jgi:hypothetical protein
MAVLVFGGVGRVKAPHPFLAIDGEACEGDYVLMNRSGGAPMTDLRPGGLRSVTCLEYLLGSPRPSLLVCFGLGYDVNNWLRDVPRPTLEKLWSSNVAYWGDYRLEWVRGRWFAVKSVDGRYAKVTEVFGFFQSSFVKALEAWGVGAPAEIARMKGERGTFKRADIEAVTRYCSTECELLVELMDGVRDACTQAGTTPKSWIGAGSIAAALLARHDVAAHHRYDLDIASDHVATEVVAGAYFGGRVELLRQGVHRNVAAADLRSAYPAAMLELPSLRGAKLRKRKRFNPARAGIWRVRWDCTDGNSPSQLLAPFPVRHKMSIFYPLAGEGHYHTIEVATAIELGYPVQVLYGYVLAQPVKRRDDRPFAWIADTYQARLRFKREGRAAEKMVKLGINSVYGKLAQGYGFNSRPRYQSYFWAGQVTAATRARVLRAAVAAKDPIMVATDGIYAAGFKGLGRPQGLGAWERGSAEKLFAAQPGVYEASSGGETVQKSRGFFASEIDYAELEAGWELEGSDYVHHYDSTRFNGLGSSLARKDFSVWRKWIAEPRSILLWPERKIQGEDGRQLPFPGRLVSEPYKPKVSLIDARALDQIDGMDQPMQIEI